MNKEISNLLNHDYDVLRAERDLYQKIFESAGVGIVVIESSRIVSSANNLFLNLLGYTKEEMEGKMLFDLFTHPEDLARSLSYHAHRRSGGKEAPLQYELRLVDRFHRVHPVLIQVSYLSESAQSIATCIDLKSLKDKERSLSDMYDELIQKKREVDEKNITLHEVLAHKQEVADKSLTYAQHSIEQLFMPVLTKAEAFIKDERVRHLFRELRQKIDEYKDTSSIGKVSYKKNLSRREAEICALIQKGHKGQEIAKILSISFKTLETHRKNIRKKLGLTRSQTNLRSFLMYF
jgi:PAS domain S-box-containing protein